MRQRYRLVVVAAAALFLLLTFDLLGSQGPNWELDELHNATAAREVSVGNGALLPYFQSTDFCGGCSAVAALGGLSFALFGVNWLAWKAVPIAFGLATLLLGMAFVRRAAGERAAGTFGVLFVCCPPVLGQAWLYARGNHTQVLPLLFATALAAQAVRAKPSSRRWAALGAAAAVSVWFTPTALPPVLAVTGVALVTAGRGLLPLLWGALVGAAPAWVFWAMTGRDPVRYFLRSGVTGDWDLAGVPARLGEATWVQATLGLAGEADHGAGLWVLALGVGWLAARRRALVPAAMWLAALLAFCLAPVARDQAALLERLPDAYAARWLVVPWTLGLPVAAIGLERLGRGRWIWMLLALGVAAPLQMRLAAHDGREGRFAVDGPQPYDYEQWACDPGHAASWPDAGFCHVPDAVLAGWASPDFTSRVNAGRLRGCERLAAFRSLRPGQFDDFAAEMGALPQPSWAWHGLGRCLSWQLTLAHPRHPDTPEQAIARVHAAIERLPPAEGRALALGTWTGPGTWTERLDPAVEGCPLCPHRWARADPRVLEQAARGELRLPDSPGARRDLLLGLGFRVGRANQAGAPHFEALRRGLVEQADAEGAALFDDGVRIGAAAVRPAPGGPVAVEYVP